MSFEVRQKNSFSYLVSPLWEQAGIGHGFIGATADFSSVAFPHWEGEFLRAFGANALFLPEQMHSADAIDLRSEEAMLSVIARSARLNFSQGDAILLPRCTAMSQAIAPGTRLAFGIRTADCLPILLLSKQSIGLIHAGWRGLAAGIIESVLEKLSPEGILSVLIGPAASRARYEVGGEVIEAIGERALYGTSAAPNKFFHYAQPRIERHCDRRPYDKLRAFDPEGRACHERGLHGPSRMEPKDKALGLVPRRFLPCDKDPDVKELICRGTSSGGKYRLDLKATAQRIVQRMCPAASVSVSSICTISDKSFHSYRRDGVPPRSNCMFVLVPCS